MIDVLKVPKIQIASPCVILTPSVDREVDYLGSIFVKHLKKQAS